MRLGAGSRQKMAVGHEDGVRAVSVLRVHIGPDSAWIVDCDLDCELDDFILEPVINFPSKVLVSRAFNSVCLRSVN
jgi:hypothetical protein